uniref:Uncharacterized protein n=1 Tax=Meloidogyne enterolobii TaxID=390850 RepID=A0A6V7UAV5_MELEN|nr:unnamed protein product [Meloidogyne enterolobii]
MTTHLMMPFKTAICQRRRKKAESVKPTSRGGKKDGKVGGGRICKIATLLWTQTNRLYWWSCSFNISNGEGGRQWQRMIKNLGKTLEYWHKFGS